MNPQTLEQEILDRIQSDHHRMQILNTASSLNLPNWCIAAGFVRNLVWDYLHSFTKNTPINDVDLVYFDEQETSEESDKALEIKLTKLFPCKWSVKNQARMHENNNDQKYTSTLDAMSFWPEIETAIGASLRKGKLELVSPFPLKEVLRNTVTLNPKRPKPQVVAERMQKKAWLKYWPQLEIKNATN